MDKDIVELKELYGIKEFQGGSYGEGVRTCLRFMHKECERLKKIIDEKDKIITHFTRKARLKE